MCMWFMSTKNGTVIKEILIVWGIGYRLLTYLSACTGYTNRPKMNNKLTVMSIYFCSSMLWVG